MSTFSARPPPLNSVRLMDGDDASVVDVRVVHTLHNSECFCCVAGTMRTTAVIPVVTAGVVRSVWCTACMTASVVQYVRFIGYVMVSVVQCLCYAGCINTSVVVYVV